MLIYSSLLYPLLAMVALTYLVMPLMLMVRVNAVRYKEISARYFITFQSSEEVPQKVQQFSRHFTNLFEVPVLFYAVAILALALNIHGPTIGLLGWAYVCLRATHTMVHLTYNALFHRMAPFILSNVVLLLLWALVGWQAHQEQVFVVLG